MAIIQQLPRGPRVRLTASVSLSIPAWSADLDFWSNAISLEAALTINRFFACCELNLLPCCNRLTLLFFNPPCTREIQKLNTIRNPFPQTGKEKKKSKTESSTCLEREGRIDAVEIAFADAIFWVFSDGIRRGISYDGE